MGNHEELYHHSKRFETDFSRDEYQSSNEQVETWFLGSLMRVKKPQKDSFIRLMTLHNRITQEDTGYDDRLQSNMRVASHLAEFFPFKWLLEITATFRKLDSTKLGIKSFDDRVSSYLGFIELYLTFRGLTLLDSTLTEINETLDLCITKNAVRSWKMKLLRIIPELRQQWVQTREKNHQTAIFSTVIQVMNKELELTSFSKEEVFQIKQIAFKSACETSFISIRAWNIMRYFGQKIKRIVYQVGSYWKTYYNQYPRTEVSEADLNAICNSIFASSSSR